MMMRALRRSTSSTIRFRSYKTKKNLPSKVRMVGVNGENMGIVSYKSALEDAKKDKMGLLCVNGRSDPPVYRLMSRNDIHRKEKADRKKKHAQKPKPTKQITFSVKIHDHDRNTKVRVIFRFLSKFKEGTTKTRPTNRHARLIVFFRKDIPCKSA